MNRMNRRSFVSAAATSVAAFATLGTAGRAAKAQLVYTKSDWKLGDFKPTGEESCAVQAAVRHYPDCEWQLPEQHQKLAEWAALRFRHTGRTDQDCCCAAWASEHAELRRLHME